MRLALVMVVVGGCGRVGFDPPPADAPLVFQRCVDDNFNDGEAADWTRAEGTWNVIATEGPDGSPALLTPPGIGAYRSVTQPILHDVIAARVALDFRIDAGSTGDFLVAFLVAGWTVVEPAPRYAAALFPVGGDSAPDKLVRIDAYPMENELAGRPPSLPDAAWYHVEVTFGADHAMTIDVDGDRYLASGPDDVLAGPFDVLIRFWQQGAIDNVVIDCAR